MWQHVGQCQLHDELSFRFPESPPLTMPTRHTAESLRGVLLCSGLLHIPLPRASLPVLWQVPLLLSQRSLSDPFPEATESMFSQPQPSYSAHCELVALGANLRGFTPRRPAHSCPHPARDPLSPYVPVACTPPGDGWSVEACSPLLSRWALGFAPSLRQAASCAYQPLSTLAHFCLPHLQCHRQSS